MACSISILMLQYIIQEKGAGNMATTVKTNLAKLTQKAEKIAGELQTTGSSPPDLFDQAVQQSAEALHHISKHPEDINPELLKQAIGQAGIDIIAEKLKDQSRIIGLDFDNLADLFISRYDSIHTREYYARSIKAWKQWCNAEGVNPLSVNGDMADKYSADLRSRPGISASKINALLNPVSSFYTHLVKREHLSGTPFISIKRAKVERKQSIVPTAREMKNAVSDNKTLSLAIQIMIATGCRIRALQSIQVDRQGYWTAYSKGKRHGGSITDQQVIKAINRINASKIFQDMKITTLGIYILRAFAKAGLSGGAHQCRHRFAIDLYRKSGNDPEAVRIA